MLHLATDPGSRPSAAQPRTELSMATCPGQRTMEAAYGNGCAPVWRSPAMMIFTGQANSLHTHMILRLYPAHLHCTVTPGGFEAEVFTGCPSHHPTNSVKALGCIRVIFRRLAMYS